MSARIALLTVSDRCAAGQREDRSGPVMTSWATAHHHEVVATSVVPDDVGMIVSTLLSWTDGIAPHFIFTSGGTGIAARDVTPEATRAVIEREAAGIAELLRREGMTQTPRAVLSRGIAGIRQHTMIVNLPGSPAAVRQGLDILAPLIDHMAELLRGNTEH